MTDIRYLLGPVPAFPTPWGTDRNYIVDATGAAVTRIDEHTHPGVTAEGRAQLARFIADAVNEKIQQDQR